MRITLTIPSETADKVRDELEEQFRVHGVSPSISVPKAGSSATERILDIAIEKTGENIGAIAVGFGSTLKNLWQRLTNKGGFIIEVTLADGRVIRVKTHNMPADEIANQVTAILYGRIGLAAGEE